ncbi:MAG: carboxylating nicotinate-nucleotide diphosphorylase [Thermoleophilia bacterium]
MSDSAPTPLPDWAGGPAGPAVPGDGAPSAPPVATGVIASSPQMLAGVGGPGIYEVVRLALAEDLGDLGDVTAQVIIPDRATATAVLVPRSAGVLAGRAAAEEVLRQCGLRGEWTAQDGDALTAGTAIATIAGPARALLAAERTMLNLVCHLSGIATMARAFVDACAPAQVLDTRKTTPMLRDLEKAAVAAGGGTNHRRGLSDRVLVKDNHLAIAGGALADAVRAARGRWPDLLVEVEADDLDGVRAALDAGADWILLDNMDDDHLRQAVALVAGRARLEASGGMNLQRAAAAAACGVDAVSVGALTHSAPALDLGLDIRS